jgi:long-subunit fatty acid transport protein
MRKIVLSLMLFSGAVAANAGGILTNSNQSAAYVRMLSRNASTDMDAVFYNPAGLALLKDGFHISLNNQFLFQKRSISNDYPYLNDKAYTGDVTIPFFPSFYAAYKKNDWTFFAGFTPTGGGGKATFNNGLPSFEVPASDIPTLLTQKGIATTDYALDMSFDGTSVIYGGQAGASYKVNRWLSVSAGARFVFAKNTYDGHLSNIRINPVSALNPTGGFISAPKFFSQMAASATGAASSLQPIITANYGGLTLQQAQAANILNANQVAALQAGLGKDYNAAMTIAQVQTAYQGNAAMLGAYATATADKQVDATQTGTGITPIIGVNINPNDKLNIGVRYEFRTKISLKNDTKVDGTGMFPDGKRSNSDMPAVLAVGVDYRILPDLKLSGSWTHYFDKDANWNGKEKFITDNLYEIALGFEYDVTPKMQVSGGYLYVQTGAGQGYQSDINFSLSSNSVAFGSAFKVSEKMKLNMGMIYTQYVEGTRYLTYNNGITAKETYNKNNLGFAIGIDYRF